MMSSTGQNKRSLREAMSQLYRMGGVRAYYRGLTVRSFGKLSYNCDLTSPCRSASLESSREPPVVVPVFLETKQARRYAAIDMSTFEALKLAYLRSTGKTEPGVLAMLAFGSVSGSVGATMVYPLNLVRTRLQAAGSSGHPQQYTGFRDVAMQTYHRDGWRGFYRGLVPTLSKVGCARLVDAGRL
jgi:solute carrier family 25 phosphate transporter 23/24/25/41